MNAGNRIKSVRQKLGLDQPAFGERIGKLTNQKAVSGSAVSRWESNDTLPSAKRLKAIADLGDVTVEYLLHGSRTSEMKQLLLQLIVEEYCHPAKVTFDDHLGNKTKLTAGMVIDLYLFSHNLISDLGSSKKPYLFDNYVNKSTGKPSPKLYDFFKKNIPLLNDDEFIASLDRAGSFNYKDNSAIKINPQVASEIFFSRLISQIDNKVLNDKLTTKNNELSAIRREVSVKQEKFYKKINHSFDEINATIIALIGILAKEDTSMAKNKIDELIQNLQNIKSKL